MLGGHQDKSVTHSGDFEACSTNRNVDELAIFYILRVSNVFNILLIYMHNNAWFGPSYVGKSSPTF